MDANKKNIIISVAVVVAVVAVLLIAGYFSKGGYRPAVNTGGVVGGGATGAGKTTATGGSATRQTVSSNVTVPNTTSTVSGDVAKPSVVAQAAPGSSANFRSFSIKVSGNAFSPSTVIVNVGDTVHLNIAAGDKDYDFYQPDYGLSLQLPKGVTKVVEFQATSPDKYTFYCKSCGGPSSGPVGYVVVVTKK